MEISNVSMLNEMKIKSMMASNSFNNEYSNNQNVDFGQVFKKMVGNVNASNSFASELKNRFVQGDPSVSLVDTKIASEMASLKTTFLTSSVQKALKSYKEIINMPL